MINIFNEIDKFFGSLNDYLDYNKIFLIFLSLFLVAAVVVIFSTSRAYESRLIKSIDMFNNYFIDTPQINEDNLVAFNAKMKHRNVPKQLRKQWQSFVLYREKKASEYMSFETCVSNPIKNSTYKRDMTTMNILAHTFALCALLLNIYFSYEVDLASILQKVLLGPIIILLLNYILTIFLDLKHNAIVSDLHQNYQYFEVNIDKATSTIPEYVDYEVLFDKNEIKKGIPILYAYLQKRAEEEKRELERARLRNVEHEKFNFDEAGVNASLVLERAMQEAENYIAERKKYNQDTEQINADITQEDMNYREITKEYNRQMQVSKETFANFKAQLEEETSSIGINYLKKQQQQELDRQRNLERDFDAQTERHKKIIESYNAELDSVDKFRAESRRSLENAMLSEFETYNSKIYDEVRKLVQEREKEKFDKFKQDIRNLEEKLVSKDKELGQMYSQNQQLLESLEQNGIDHEDVSQPEPQTSNEPQYEETYQEEPAEDTQYEDYQGYDEQYQEKEPEVAGEEQYADAYQEEPVNKEPYEEPIQEEPMEEQEEQAEYGFKYVIPEDLEEDYDNLESEEDEGFETREEEKLPEYSFKYVINDDFEQDENSKEDNIEEFINSEYIIKKDDESQKGEISDTSISTKIKVESENLEPKKRPGRPRKIVTEIEPKKPVGRPRKEVVEEEPKRKPGRPKKVEISVEIKKGPGRPKKITEEAKVEKKSVGRPRKEVVVEEPKRKPGRPSKATAEDSKKKVGRPRKTEAPVMIKKGPGRPRKVEIEEEPKRKPGRPSKVATEEAKKKVGRPRKTEAPAEVKKGKRGRPRKDGGDSNPTNPGASSQDLDAYLKEISQAIADENAKLEQMKKELEKKADISGGKK